MATLTNELPSQASQKAFNLRRWEEILNDPLLSKYQGRIETNRHGHPIMGPPASFSHGSLQGEIAYQLRNLLPNGSVLSECPISTADGVKVADVAWASLESMKNAGNRVCFTRSPEICVEVISPSNTRSEIEEKRRLYFDAGANEVWICSGSGLMTFFVGDSQTAKKASVLCPKFPAKIIAVRGLV